VLRDSSGNRRFMLFDISSIEHSFELVDGGQIAAQSYALAEEKFKPSAAAEKIMNEILVAETPVSPDKLFVEEINKFLGTRYDDISQDKIDVMLGKIHAGKDNIPDKLRWFQISEDVTKIARKYGFKIKRCQQIMKRSGMTHTDEVSSFYVPSKLDA
jgi:hypothetical protein